MIPKCLTSTILEIPLGCSRNRWMATSHLRIGSGLHSMTVSARKLSNDCTVQLFSVVVNLTGPTEGMIMASINIRNPATGLETALHELSTPRWR